MTINITSSTLPTTVSTSLGNGTPSVLTSSVPSSIAVSDSQTAQL